MPLKGTFPHEMALRLVLQMLQTSAGRYKRYIVPLMSCSIDFYLRVFVRVYTSPNEVKKAARYYYIFYFIFKKNSVYALKKWKKKKEKERYL